MIANPRDCCTGAFCTRHPVMLHESGDWMCRACFHERLIEEGPQMPIELRSVPRMGHRGLLTAGALIFGTFAAFCSVSMFLDSHITGGALCGALSLASFASAFKGDDSDG